jgi:hypothetical protein
MGREHHGTRLLTKPIDPPARYAVPIPHSPRIPVIARPDMSVSDDCGPWYVGSRLRWEAASSVCRPVRRILVRSSLTA